MHLVMNFLLEFNIAKLRMRGYRIGGGVDNSAQLHRTIPAEYSRRLVLDELGLFYGPTVANGDNALEFFGWPKKLGLVQSHCSGVVGQDPSILVF